MTNYSGRDKCHPFFLMPRKRDKSSVILWASNAIEGFLCTLLSEYRSLSQNTDFQYFYIFLSEGVNMCAADALPLLFLCFINDIMKRGIQTKKGNTFQGICMNCGRIWDFFYNGVIIRFFCSFINSRFWAIAIYSFLLQNIQSTNWQSLRFKPPPPNSNIGWRVEFRPMEVIVH